VVTPAAHREAVAHLRSVYGMSERRACRVLGVDRASVRYQATRPDDGALRVRLKALAQERRRFGYRRLHVMLRREGHAVNRKRVQRIYREEKLMVRRRGGRKRAMGTRRPLEVPLVANQRWSLDFVSDQMTDGRRFRIPTVIDNCTRQCLGLVADTSLSGQRVARELDAIMLRRGRPDTIISDNGTEYTSNAILGWADEPRRIETLVEEVGCVVPEAQPVGSRQSAGKRGAGRGGIGVHRLLNLAQDQPAGVEVELRIMLRRGRPDTIISDNGTEYTSNAILGWADEPRRIETLVEEVGCVVPEAQPVGSRQSAGKRGAGRGGIGVHRLLNLAQDQPAGVEVELRAVAFATPQLGVIVEWTAGGLSLNTPTRIVVEVVGRTPSRAPSGRRRTALTDANGIALSGQGSCITTSNPSPPRNAGECRMSAPPLERIT